MRKRDFLYPWGWLCGHLRSWFGGRDATSIHRLWAGLAMHPKYLPIAVEIFEKEWLPRGVFYRR
ncbi:MAG: hypothetical protein ACRD50_07270 [Candidatus Acidiferrales bacterium]